MEPIKIKMSADLKSAMKEKNTTAIKTLRFLISAIDNAGAVPVEKPEIMPMSGGIAGATNGIGSTEVARKELSEEDIKQIIKKEIDEIEKAVDLIKNYSRPKVEELSKQIDLLRKYL